VILRRDHVAGGAFVVAGLAVLAVSGDYPFGTLASPGAGMLPVLIVLLVLLFGAAIFLRAGESPLLATIDWSDFTHGLTVISAAVAAAFAYTELGFIITIPLMLFFLTAIAERRSLPWALAFSVGVTAVTYGLFKFVLKTPLPGLTFGL
jgi:hypothetical protein